MTDLPARSGDLEESLSGSTDTPAGLSLEDYHALRDHLERVRRAGSGSQMHKQALDHFFGHVLRKSYPILCTLAAALGEPVPAKWPQNMVTRQGETTEIGG